jgi:hypothetical protein
VFFVCLDIGTKFEFAVFSEVDMRARHDGTWAQGVRHTIPCRKGVQPEHTVINEFGHHASGNFCERHSVVNTAGAFFDRADVSLGLWDVLASGDGVKGDPELSQVASNSLKLPVH